MSAGVVSLLEQWAADYGNVRAAVEWAAASEPCAGLRMLAETKDLFFILGQADGSRLAEMILERCPERNRHRAEVMIAAGHFAFQLGEVTAASDLLMDAAEMGVEMGERAEESTARLFLGLQEMLGGAPDKARGHLLTARAIQQKTGDLVGEARTTAVLGLTYGMEGDAARARELLEAALAMGLAAQDRWSQGGANLYLGIIAESSRDQQGASSYFREAVECQRPSGDSTLLPVALIGQSTVLTRRDPATALQIVAVGRTRSERRRVRAVLPGVRGTDPRLSGRACRQRRRPTLENRFAVDRRRRHRAGIRHDSNGRFDELRAATGGLAHSRISTREIDVVRLIAEGLSNKEIARRLHLSVRTVETHVRHMLTKTGLVNRTQLATWARERGE
jgi:DNA-binding NarL/FixJ family response regulator